MSRYSGNNEVFNQSALGTKCGVVNPPSSQTKKKRRAPFSLALASEERARLEAAAGELPLGTYIKGRLFEDLPAVPRQNRRSKTDREALAKALGMLGQSRLSSNMNQIARSANRGLLPLTPELIKDLNAACEEIRIMRVLLVEALGVRGASK